MERVEFILESTRNKSVLYTMTTEKCAKYNQGAIITISGTCAESRGARKTRLTRRIEGRRSRVRQRETNQ